MAYDEDLADRLRELVGDEPDVTERRMFGGLAFLAGGNLAVAASSKGGLMVRVDPAQAEALLAQAGVRPFEMNGRELDGWGRVDAEGVRTDDRLGAWAERGLGHARSLPPKAS